MGAAKLMRILGILSILFGLLIAFGYPTYHDTFANFEIGKYAIYDKSAGFQDQTIWLTPKDGPVEISFEANMDGTRPSAETATSFMLQINNADQLLLSELINLAPAAEGDATTAPLQFEINNLPVTDSALHAFVFSSSDWTDSPISNINMTITGIAVVMNDTLPTVGYVLVGLGAILYLVGGRRKAKKSGKPPTGRRSKTSQIGRRAEPVASKPKEAEEPARKWGRDGD